MTPTRILLNPARNQLTLEYPGGVQFQLSAEYLRVSSPSAEVRGHGNQTPVLQYGKRLVSIEKIAKSGNYALQLTFSDGHDSGIYSWEYLHHLGQNQTANWEAYLQRLHNEGKSRDGDVQVVRLFE